MTTADYFQVKLDSAATIIDFNSAASEISGYSPREVIGSNWFEVFIDEPDLVTVLKVFQDIFLGRTMYWEYTNNILIKSGETIPMQWKNEIITDERGKRAHIVPGYTINRLVFRVPFSGFVCMAALIL